MAGTAWAEETAAHPALDSSRAVVVYIVDQVEHWAQVRELLGWDCDVFVAGHGANGLAKARRYQADLLLVEDAMPVTEASALLRVLHADRELAGIPVMALTAASGADRGLLEEARQLGNRERMAPIEDEMQALARELASAIGLGGRDRKAAAVAERARINVTRTIKAAISAIAEHHRPLAQHLKASVRTGVFCCYAPAPAARGFWSIG